LPTNQDIFQRTNNKAPIMKRLLSILIVLFLSFSITVKADEGMWLLPLLEKLNIGKMTELGLKLSAEDIYSINKASIKDAIVIFNGYCTGEIVSDQGLVLTNHHCGYESIQSHSTLANDYLQDGFWAMTKAEELPNPDMYVTFLVSIEDVTNKVLEKVKPGMSETERTGVISDARLALQKSAVTGTDYTATVTSFYGGNYFYLLKYETYDDLRLVGAPPSSIGKFGFDTDNWEWPRHTGDFSVFRVYMSPDGKPATYSKDNVPLKPKYFLPVSIKEINKGDFSMILGYPGSTQRYATSYEVNEIMKIINPNRIKIRGMRQEILMSDMMADQKVNIQYASKYSTSSNYWKYSIGENQILEKLNVKDQKQQIEDQYNRWIAADPSLKEKYGAALDLVKTSIEGRAEFRNAQQYISEAFALGCEILSFSRYANALVIALKSGDNQTIQSAVDDIRTLSEGFYKDYNAPTDKKVMKAMLKLYRTDVPSKFHPDFYNIVDKKFKGSTDLYVDNLFSKSIFTDENKLNAFLNKPVLKALENDPVYITGSSISRISSLLAQETARFDSDLATGRRLWVAALMQMTPQKTLYPDANFTMRLTYGTVQDYDPRDAVTYKYYTTLDGVMEKYKPGDYEFDIPKRLIDLYNAKDYGRYASAKGYMPVCFTTTNDITGGNSGSPVLNGNGELIGLAFDGNWEAMSSNIAFEPALQRTIIVDIRYVLWIMDKYAGAKHLVDEMTVIQ
jgi:V8-like Glu-specific endopeptidase